MNSMASMNTSWKSLFSKTLTESGPESNNGSEAGSESGSNMIENDNEDSDENTVALKSNPLLLGLNEIFD
jgi:hypothetical protein